MFENVACRLAFVLASVTACAPTASDGGRGSAEPAYPSAQSWALGDGVVSETEYRFATDGFVSCVRDAGFSISDPMISPIDGVTLLYDLTPSGNPDEWNRKVEECNLAHISHIEPVYVETHDQTMAPELRSATATCLNEKGLEVRGTERNVKDFVDSTPGRIGNTVLECVTTAMPLLFPQMPDLLKIRW